MEIKDLTPPPTPHELDQETWKMIEGPFMQTWQAIGHDVMDVIDDGDNEQAVEMVLDADRMTMYGDWNGDGDGEAATKLVRALVKKFGYLSVLQWAASNARLV